MAVLKAGVSLAPSAAVEVELAVRPDPGPGAGRQVGGAAGVEGGRRVAAAPGRPGHVGSDHGGGEGTRLPAGGVTWSHNLLVTGHNDLLSTTTLTSPPYWMASPKGNL